MTKKLIQFIVLLLLVYRITEKEIEIGSLFDFCAAKLSLISAQFDGFNSLFWFSLIWFICSSYFRLFSLCWYMLGYSYFCFVSAFANYIDKEFGSAHAITCLDHLHIFYEFIRKNQGKCTCLKFFLVIWIFSRSCSPFFQVIRRWCAIQCNFKYEWILFLRNVFDVNRDRFRQNETSASVRTGV